MPRHTVHADLFGARQRIASLQSELEAAKKERDEAREVLDIRTLENFKGASVLRDHTKALAAAEKKVEELTAEKMTARQNCEQLKGQLVEQAAIIRRIVEYVRANIWLDKCDNRAKPIVAEIEAIALGSANEEREGGAE